MGDKTGISSESVKSKTGKGWDEWLAVLDQENAQTIPHKEIATLLRTKYEISPWWAQMVTVGYERARGLREMHETKQGFVASVSRTIKVSRPELWEMLQDAQRTQWLRVPHEAMSSNAPKSLRLKFADGSRVEFGLLDKGPRKSSISVQHAYLKNADQVQEKKEFWQDTLDRLKHLVEAHPPTLT